MCPTRLRLEQTDEPDQTWLRSRWEVGTGVGIGMPALPLMSPTTPSRSSFEFLDASPCGSSLVLAQRRWGGGRTRTQSAKPHLAPSVAAQICQLPVSTRSVTQVTPKEDNTREAFAQGARFFLQAIRLAYQNGSIRPA